MIEKLLECILNNALKRRKDKYGSYYYKRLNWFEYILFQRQLKNEH